VVLGSGLSGGGRTAWDGRGAGFATVVFGIAAVAVAVSCGAFGWLEGSGTGGRLDGRWHYILRTPFDAEAIR
jgi:hypothetical protein